MTLLCAMVGAESVKEYRGHRAPVDKAIVNKKPGPELVEWVQENGLDWSGFWTNDWDMNANAFAGVMRDLEIPVIVDVDDYFEDVPRGNIANKAWVYERPKLYRAMLKDADRRVCSTPFLAEKYDAKVAPNFMTPSEWEYPVRPKTNDRITLLHCGSIMRAEDYLTQEKAFRKFLEEPNTQIIFMGWLPAWARDYPNEKAAFCAWTPYREEPWGLKYNRMLRWLDPDIVASPLQHNDFNRAKSNIKWLESAMVGACFVGERWGELERTVKDGTTGHLCDGIDEWTEKLVSLARDRDVRIRTSQAAKDVVLSDWTWDKVGADWKAALGV